MLEAMASPITLVARRCKSFTRRPGFTVSLIACSTASWRKSKSRSRTKLATGALWSLTIAAVRGAELISMLSREIAAAGDARGGDVVGIAAEPDMRDDGAALLGEARDLQNHGRLLIQMRRHAEDTADSQDSGSADAGDRDFIGRVEN